MPQFKFKPCPFCGGEDVVIKRNSSPILPESIRRFNYTWIVCCYSCGLILPHDSREQVITAWNKRTDDKIISKMKQYGFSHDEKYPAVLWVEKLVFEWRRMRNNLDSQRKLIQHLTKPTN